MDGVWRTTPVGAIRRGRFKLLEYFEDGRRELYDLAADPAEETDLHAAEPEVAASLLAGRPLQFSRAGEVSTRIPDARRIETLAEVEATQILETMEAKYGDRVAAADGQPGAL